ncbi:MAG: site-specific integrase [Proteobacteria bacterium]|jgi:integrase|nr:site-specific integrase [Pseudomonadota bacterium]MDA1351288.1 site-specific integrase [Pseudomonadota bacterium]
MRYTQKHPQHTYTKRDIYYFSRVIPSDLRHHYIKPRIIQSLKTKSEHRASTASKMLSAKLDDYWLGLRLKQVDVPASHLLVSGATVNLESNLPTIDEALETYLSVKGRGKSDLFYSHTRRSIKYLKDSLGSRSLDQYTSADAAKLRDWFVLRGLAIASIKRNFGSIKAVVNFVVLEQGLTCSNPFNGVYLYSDNSSKKRKPIATNNLKAIQAKCMEVDDDLRHLVSLISDTGMRLSEATGLMNSDINLDCDYPHIVLTPYPHRTLKTLSSERIVPLVGQSLWAARRIIESTESLYCFPRYTSASGCNANSASAAINKWIKTVAGSEAVIHGLRHSFRDRLRAVETPSEIIDQLGGWSLKSVGQGYGDGYQLNILSKWIEKIVIQ